jgi:hypothetical protein
MLRHPELTSPEGRLMPPHKNSDARQPELEQHPGRTTTLGLSLRALALRAAAPRRAEPQPSTPQPRALRPPALMAAVLLRSALIGTPLLGSTQFVSRLLGLALLLCIGAWGAPVGAQARHGHAGAGSVQQASTDTIAIRAPGGGTAQIIISWTHSREEGWFVTRVAGPGSAYWTPPATWRVLAVEAMPSCPAAEIAGSLALTVQVLPSTTPTREDIFTRPQPTPAGLRLRPGGWDVERIASSCGVVLGQ